MTDRLPDRQTDRAVTGSLPERAVPHDLTRPGGWNWTLVLMVAFVGPCKAVSKLRPPLGTVTPFDRVTRTAPADS